VAGMPHRIEHVQCNPPERFDDAAAAGLVCSMQPAHLMTDWRVADRYWGRLRSRTAFAFASLLRQHTLLAFGSDAPVEPVDPRLGLHAAVCRTDTAGLPAGGWFADERISARDALLGYTVGPARAAGLAAPAGSLGIGAPADFVAWDTDPLARPESLLAMRCAATVVNGVVEYSC
jgi:predicted amidohydrolase YtcJ